MIGTICDEFECYEYRRVGAALRHQGVVVNGKKLRRLMREHGLQPERRRRYVVTTDSNHGGLIYPDLARDLVPDRPNQLWGTDLCLRGHPGRLPSTWRPSWTPGRARGGRLRHQTLHGRVDRRGGAESGYPEPCTPEGLHSPLGPRVAIRIRGVSRVARGLAGLMSRRGNPYGNARAESFMKTLKVEAVYLAVYESFEIRRWAISAPCSSRINTLSRRSKQRPEPAHPEGRTPMGGG